MRDEFLRAVKCGAAYIAIGIPIAIGFSELVIRPGIEAIWPTPSMSLDKAFEVFQKKNIQSVSAPAAPAPNN